MYLRAYNGAWVEGQYAYMTWTENRVTAAGTLFSRNQSDIRSMKTTPAQWHQSFTSLQSMCSILIALASTYPALGQANFLFRNIDSGGRVPVNAPVFDAQGVPLAGTNYLAELWGAAAPDS